MSRANRDVSVRPLTVEYEIKRVDLRLLETCLAKPLPKGL